MSGAEETEAKIAQAWQSYIPLNSEEYEQANQERFESAKVQVYKWGEPGHSFEMIASVNVDPVSGKSISGHDYKPEAQSMSDIETEFGKYLAETPEDRRSVIYEGDERLFDDRDEAIRQASESGLVQWLAREHGAEAVSGEPGNEELVEILEERGISRLDLATMYCVWDRSVVEAAYNEGKAEELWGNLNHNAAAVGLEGFKLYSEAEKAQIQAEGRVEELMDSFKAPVGELVARINETVRPQLGRDLFIIEDGRISVDAAGQTREELIQEQISLYNPVSEGALSSIGRAASEARDAHLTKLTLEAYESGQSPFVVYGGSHVVCLKPVFDEYFTARKITA